VRIDRSSEWIDRTSARVVLGTRKLEQPVLHRAAAEENFFLRGLNHLLVFEKERRRAAGDGR
jgi:hypothetical protein